MPSKKGGRAGGGVDRDGWRQRRRGIERYMDVEGEMEEKRKKERRKEKEI